MGDEGEERRTIVIATEFGELVFQGGEDGVKCVY
jgi:hypothetical protein